MNGYTKCGIYIQEYYSTLKKKNSLSHSGYRMPHRLRMPLEVVGAVLANRSLA